MDTVKYQYNTIMVQSKLQKSMPGKGSYALNSLAAC